MGEDPWLEGLGGAGVPQRPEKRSAGKDTVASAV